METNTTTVETAQPRESWGRVLGEIVGHLLFIAFIVLAGIAAWRADWSAATFYLLLTWCSAWLEKNRWRKNDSPKAR